MLSFLSLRLPKKRLWLAVSIALAISCLQMTQILNFIPVGESTYTRWLSIALLINFLFYFTIFPNIRPDNLLNRNILLINQNTMLVGLYYAHPLLHAAISILFASLWGGLFSVFVMVTSVWIKNSFVALSTGLCVQILVLMLNSFLTLPSLASYSPADFLHELSPNANINLTVTGIVTLLMIIYCISLAQIGEKRLVS